MSIPRLWDPKNRLQGLKNSLNLQCNHYYFVKRMHDNIIPPSLDAMKQRWCSPTTKSIWRVSEEEAQIYDDLVWLRFVLEWYQLANRALRAFRYKFEGSRGEIVSFHFMSWGFESILENSFNDTIKDTKFLISLHSSKKAHHLSSTLGTFILSPV
jgi:hypothetical protein